MINLIFVTLGLIIFLWVRRSYFLFKKEKMKKAEAFEKKCIELHLKDLDLKEKLQQLDEKIQELYLKDKEIDEKNRKLALLEQGITAFSKALEESNSRNGA